MDGPIDRSAPGKTSAKAALRESVALLFSRRFGTFFVASLLSNMGTWAQQIAEPWLLLSLGASPFIIGLDSFASSAPAWGLTLIGGLLADRGDRRLVIARFQSIQMLCPLALVVLLLTGQVQPWIVVVLSLVVGITDALSMPSFQTITPTIVERRQIGTALALNATQFNLSRMLGPLFAGVLMSAFGAIACFAANAASFIPFIVVALWILPKGAPAAAGRGTEAIRLATTLRRVRSDRDLAGSLATVFLTGLFCGPLIVFSPVLIRDVLQADVTAFGGAVGAFGAGGLLGSTLLLALGPAVDRRMICSLFAIAYGAAEIGAALAPWVPGTLLSLAVGGVAMSMSNISANTTLQTAAPRAMLGQSVSLFMLALRGGLSAGSLVTGVTVGWLGARHALAINGALAMIVQTAVAGRWWWR
jgi:MFS family permease